MGSVKAGKAYVELTADDAKLVKGLRRAQERLVAFRDSVTSVGKTMMTMGTAMAAPAVLSARAFASFDDAMRMVRAVTGASGKEFDSLTDKARKLGRETSFTAKQVAEGMGSLGRMGFTTGEIDSAIGAMLDLSLATGTELSRASEIAAASLRTFGLSASDTSSIADILATTANNSAQTLDDLGESLKIAAPQAAAAGEDIRNVAGALGVLANMGIKGTMAGTALKNAYVQFSNASVQEKLRRMGIETMDANGNLREMPNILADVGKAMASMPTGEKLSFANQIFGRIGSAGGLNLSTNAAQLDAFIQKLKTKTAGAARDTAAEMESGIGGTIRTLSSAFEGVTLSFGKIVSEVVKPYMAAISSALTQTARWIDGNKGVVVGFVKATAAILAAGVAVYGIGKSMTIATAALGVMTTAVHASVSAFLSLKSAWTFLRGLQFWMSGPLVMLPALAGVALYVSGAFDRLGETAKAAFGVLGGSLKEAFQLFKQAFLTGDLSAMATVALSGVKIVFYGFMAEIADKWAEWSFTITDAFGRMGDWILKAWMAVKTSILSTFADVSNAMGSFMDGLAKTWNYAKALTPGSGFTLEQAAADNTRIDVEARRRDQETARRKKQFEEEYRNGLAEIDRQRDAEEFSSRRDEWRRKMEEAKAEARKAIEEGRRKAEDARKTAENSGGLGVSTGKTAMPNASAWMNAGRTGFGSFSAALFAAGGGEAGWSLVRDIRSLAEKIERNTAEDASLTFEG